MWGEGYKRKWFQFNFPTSLSWASAGSGMARAGFLLFVLLFPVFADSATHKSKLAEKTIIFCMNKYLMVAFFSGLSYLFAFQSSLDGFFFFFLMCLGIRLILEYICIQIYGGKSLFLLLYGFRFSSRFNDLMWMCVLLSSVAWQPIAVNSGWIQVSASVFYCFNHFSFIKAMGCLIIYAQFLSNSWFWITLICLVLTRTFQLGLNWNLDLFFFIFSPLRSSSWPSANCNDILTLYPMNISY